MSVKTKSKTINVNLMRQTAIFTINQILLALFRIIRARGLSPQPLIDRRKAIEEGFFTWISEQTLKVVILEIFQPGTNQAIQRFEFSFSYSSEPNETIREVSVTQIEAFLRTLKKLPAGTTYDILVIMKPGATKVPGWKSTQLKHLNVKQKTSLGGWGYGYTDIEMWYLGS